MSFRGRLVQAGLDVLARGTTVLSSMRNGNLVKPPNNGPYAKLPTTMNMMVHSRFVDDFFRWEASGSNVGGWKNNAIGNGLNAGPVVDGGYSLNGDVSFATDNTAIGDGAHFEWDSPAICQPAAGRPYWFSCRVRMVTSAAGVHIRIGLSANTANPFAADPNGIFFVLGETDTKLGSIVKNAAGTTEDADHDVTLAADTWYELSWYYDGAGNVKLFKDGVHLSTVTTNIPVGLSLTPFFAAITHTAGANKIVAVDFIQVVTERPANG
jgi:hypothetical protein